METTFRQYEEHDGNTSERVWQGLVKVYSERLRKLRGKGLWMEHARVAPRWSAGTLKKVMKHDNKAVTMAWDYLAARYSDNRDHFSSFPFFTLEQGQRTVIFGPALFFWERARMKRKNRSC